MRYSLLSVSALALTATAANAGLTDAGKLGPGEPGFIGILQDTFGGTFKRQGADYVGDRIKAVRVSDAGDDSAIPAGNYAAKLIASYSSNDQAFGILGDTGFQMVAATTSYGQLNSPNVVFTASRSSTLVARDGGEGGLHASDPALNPGGKDQLITFRIEEESGDQSLLLFWEDLSDQPGVSKGRSKADYNDLVVRLSSIESAEAVVPLPASALGGLLLIGGTGLVGAYRKFRKA